MHSHDDWNFNAHGSSTNYALSFFEVGADVNILSYQEIFQPFEILCSDGEKLWTHSQCESKWEDGADSLCASRKGLSGPQGAFFCGFCKSLSCAGCPCRIQPRPQWKSGSHNARAKCRARRSPQSTSRRHWPRTCSPWPTWENVFTFAIALDFRRHFARTQCWTACWKGWLSRGSQSA